MRALLFLSHRLHARNFLASGQYEHLIAAGISVDVAASAEVQHEWGALPHGQCWLPLEQFVGGRARAKVREALRLASLVSGARRGSRTYQHKLTLDRPWLARQELRAWRWLSRVRDPERVATAIESLLPIPRRLREIPLGFYDLLILPTLMHEDNAQNDVIKAAQAKGVPVLAAPASCDTLTSKGAFLVRPDALAVWGVQSREQARAIHGFSLTKIAVTGPPWFWPYSDLSWSWMKPEHVLYAGTSIAYSRDELEIVEQIRSSLDTPLIYRPHPRRADGWTLRPAEALLTAEQVSKSHVLVTAFSTMIVEAALCGRPSVVIGFGRTAQGNGTLLDHSHYEHMAEILAKPGVSIAKSPKVAKGAIQFYLENLEPDPYLRAWALGIASVSEDPRLQMIRAVRWAAGR